MNPAINGALKLQVDYLQASFAKVIVVVPKVFVATIYRHASLAQKSEIHTYGFAKGATPLQYIEQNYKTSLLDHVKEFLFKYYVLGFLYKELYSKKILIAGEPRLEAIILDSDEAEFHFELSLMPTIDVSRWKMLPFKAPKRKNYKDIDRQVESFIKEEQSNMKKYQDFDVVSIGDWVCFDIALTDEDGKTPLGQYKENLWLKIGNEEADISYQDVFVGKKKNDLFYSGDKCFQEYFASAINTNNIFYLHIVDVVYHSFFSLEHFKTHFRLKSNKEVHQKLIEVFSYRNDLSLRRAIAEEAFKMLLSKFPFDVPNSLVLRQQKIVLEAVTANPDYQAYKTQPNFKEQIRQLALKQSKEMLLTDQIMFYENIALKPHDLKGYLNLINRPRTKEFVYFNLPTTKLDGQEMPLSSSVILAQCGLREMTFNHIIHNLTKK